MMSLGPTEILFAVAVSADIRKTCHPMAGFFLLYEK